MDHIREIDALLDYLAAAQPPGGPECDRYWLEIVTYIEGTMANIRTAVLGKHPEPTISDFIRVEAW